MSAYANQFRPRFHLTLQEAAARYGITAQALAAAVRSGKLHSKREAHRSWVTATAVMAFLNRERPAPSRETVSPTHPRFKRPQRAS